MITVKFNDVTRAVPTRWTEMDEKFSSAFVDMCPWLEKFETGKCGFEEMKTGLAVALLGIRPRRLWKINDTVSENVFRLSEFITFPYSQSKPDQDGTISVSVQVMLPRNMQPVAKYLGFFSKRKMKCVHDFGISSGGVIRCDISAELYADTLDLLEIYTESRDDGVLDDLFRKYYGHLPMSMKLNGSNRNVKLALYYNLRGYFDWIRTLPDYSLLFQQDSDDGHAPKGPAPLGSSSGIYTLSKAGYGTLEEIKRLPLFEYLGAMVQIVVDNIRELDAMKMKPTEISGKLGLSVEQIIPYLSNDNR